MPLSARTRFKQKHAAASSPRGFGSFELLWVLLVISLCASAFRFGGWLFGLEIGWGASVILGIVTPLVLMMVMGVVVSVFGSEAEVEPESPRPKPTTPSTPSSPPPKDADPCVQVLQDAEGKRRVRILRRKSGTYYFEEQYFSEHLEPAWIPNQHGAVGFYDTEQTAIREAKASLDWLIDNSSGKERSG